MATGSLSKDRLRRDRQEIRRRTYVVATNRLFWWECFIIVRQIPPRGGGIHMRVHVPSVKKIRQHGKEYFARGVWFSGEEEPTARESNSSGRKFGCVGKDSPAGEDVY